MKLGKLSQLIGAFAVATSFGLLSVNKLSATTSTVKILGLSPNNVLVRLDSGKSTQVKGIDGNLQGIDFRPANGKLYGVTDTDKIYVINPDTGAATFVKTLNTSFDGGFQSGFDFNPVPDRLRIVGSNDQNFRTNVDTGEVTVDKTLAYSTDAKEPNKGKNPNITAAAYTNSRAGATSTQLYGIDYDLNVLVLQDPPNDGTLKTVGSLKINFAPIGGFDIFTDSKGKNTAYAISGSTLYNINLSTGEAKKQSSLSRGDFIGLAVTGK
jgi:hypothetical protein